MIEVKNLVKKYKKAEKNAIDNVSFEIEEGKFFSLLGPNGAGKTTTVSVLTTTLSKTSGQVIVNGYDLDKNPEKVRKSIGVIFQTPSLDKNLTAEENIRFHAVLYGLYPFRPSFFLMSKQYKKKVAELSEVVGLGKDLFEPIKSYSGGMKRKLEIVRSLIHDPKVLFLDEPTTGLDPISRNNLWVYLTEMRKKTGMTVFLTTHYLNEAEGADTIAVMNKGKIVTMGTPEQIKKDLVEEYLLIDAKDRERLEEELKKMKVKYTKEDGIKIKANTEMIQKIISRLKTKLTNIKIHIPTLEEAYLEIINKDNHEQGN